jgi:NTE family protein
VSSSLIRVGRVADTRLIGGERWEFRETGKALNHGLPGPIDQARKKARAEAQGGAMSRSAAHPHGPARDVFVLSGGAARGAVHVGMMQTLLEAGIVPSAFVGTSVGALNAAFMGWDTGLDRVHALADQWLRLGTRDIFPGRVWSRLAHIAQRHTYLFSSDALRHLIAAWVPVERLEDLPTPVRVTTTPLVGQGVVYHDRGDLADVLLASTAVPGIFAPVDLVDGDGVRSLHVDGGIADLVPVAGAVDLQPTRVFVLDASVPPRMPHARTPIEMLVASLGAAMRARPMVDLGPDVTVHHLRTVDLGTRMTDFSRTADHLALGRRAAAELLETLSVRDEAILAGPDDASAAVVAHAGRHHRLRDLFGRAA